MNIYIHVWTQELTLYFVKPQKKANNFFKNYILLNSKIRTIVGWPNIQLIVFIKARILKNIFHFD
jgi:hypothetical protein